MGQKAIRWPCPGKGPLHGADKPRDAIDAHQRSSSKVSKAPAPPPCERADCGTLDQRTDVFASLSAPLASADLMLPKPKPVVDIVILGASGDLTRRLVVPQLFSLWKRGLLDARSTVIGVAREGFSEEEFKVRMQLALREFAQLHGSTPEWEAFSAQLGYQTAELTSTSLGDLKQRLDQHDQERGCAGTRIFDLAIPPSAVPDALRGLRGAGLLSNQGGATSAPRVIMEKPFGSDAASAHALNELVSRVISEEQAYRIDHYLGKAGVMLIPALRFQEGTVESMWNRDHVEQVEIHSREQVDVGARGEFYEETGALKDMVQSHLHQVLSLVAMEHPKCLSGNGLRDAKLEALTALKKLAPEEIETQVVRGQYRRGVQAGEVTPAYRQLEGVDPASQRETFVAVKTSIDNERWRGVPFFLVTGKALQDKKSEVIVRFKSLSPALSQRLEALNPELSRELEGRLDVPSTLILEIDPHPSVRLEIEGRVLELARSQIEAEPMKPYERLFYEAALGDQSFFVRSDEIEVMWDRADPFQEAWNSPGAAPVVSYRAGEAMPAEARTLLGWSDALVHPESVEAPDAR